MDTSSEGQEAYRASAALHPCPFCGSAARIELDWHWPAQAAAVCIGEDCAASIAGESAEAVTEQWNRRVRS